jgi:anti-sigma28 factor (negative regulator of flagellin synthesis)
MKITSPSELLRQTEIASRSTEASSPKAVKAEVARQAEVEAPPPPPEEAAIADTKLDALKKSAMTTAESEHAARLMSVAMALQSGRYSVDIMRIADALIRQ